MPADLKRALRLYRSGRNSEVIRLLEPQVFRYRQSHAYFYTIGMACLRSGDLGGADTYLKRSEDLRPDDRDTLMGLAVIHLRRLEVSEGIELILRILDKSPRDKQARRALKTVQKSAQADEVSEMADSPRLMSLLPGRGGRRVWFLLIPVLILVLGFGSYVFRNQLADALSRDSPRTDEVASLSIKELAEIVAITGEYRYVLTEAEIRRSFSQAKTYFSDYRDNLATREINRILGSNAALAVKEQARTISGLISQPDFTNIRDSFEYSVVETDPFLYAGSYVAWRGRVSNLAITEDRITFDFLVGYERNQVLEGIVTVELRFPATLDQGIPLEVLGRVVVHDDGTFHLQGTSIHKLRPV